MCYTLKIGFTGNSTVGMTPGQADRLELRLKAMFVAGAEFHHGDCVMSDAQAAKIAMGIGYIIVAHPPKDNRKRAFFPSDIVLEPKEYLDRNHDIVDVTDWLLATPKERKNRLRSGTWATVRYAYKQSKFVEVIYPER